jgi:hypothetical protein
MTEAMKKSYRFIKVIALTGILASLFGCSKREEIVTVNEKNTLQCIIGVGDETKTHLGDFYGGKYCYINWSAEDRLAVYIDSGERRYCYMLDSGDNTNSGIFSGYGNGRGSRYVALYPYSYADGYSGGTLRLTLPDTQTYVHDSFGEGFYPMIAVSQDRNLHFKNLCGIIKLSLTGTQSITSIVFKSDASSNKVSGSATLSLDDYSEPQLVMDSDASDEVTLDCKGVLLNKTTATDFNIVVPTQAYLGGFTLIIKTVSGYATKKISSDVTIARSHMVPIRQFELKLDVGVNPSASLDGKGTIDTPFLIKTLADLLCLQAAVNSVDGTITPNDGSSDVTANTAYYKMTADIDLSPVCGDMIGSWVPIADYNSDDAFIFKGCFDGNGHRIEGLYINHYEESERYSYQGLFGYLSGIGASQVKNLTVSGSITTNGYSCGGIVGESYGKVRNCVNEVSLTSTNDEVGGICGVGSDIINCINKGDISGSYFCGGVCGYHNSSYMLNCINEGNVSGSYYVGGIGGFSRQDAKTYNCSNHGNITGSEGFVGGIIGRLLSYDDESSMYNTKIANCYNSGLVNCTSNREYASYVGGICGYNQLSSVKNSYWLYDSGNSLGIEKGIGVDEGQSSFNFALTDAQMKGESTPSSLYVHSDGTSYNTLCDALNAWASQMTPLNCYGTKYDLYGWTSESGSYPMLTTIVATKPKSGE